MSQMTLDGEKVASRTFIRDYYQGLLRQMRTCNRCRLSHYMCVGGEGALYRPKVLFVGEAPGETEAKQGRPFVGRSGKLLRKAIKDILKLEDADYYITNAVKCRPPRNATPKDMHINACKFFIHREISFAKPKVIVTLGSVAFKSVLGFNGGLDKVGKDFNLRGVPVIHCPHPAFVLRGDERGSKLWKEAFEKVGEILAE